MKPTCLSLAIAFAFGFCGAAMAQSSPDTETQDSLVKKPEAESGTLGEVKVTARRRSESAQDVPVAVSAFDEDELRQLQASNVIDLQGAVPNMNLVQGRGSSNSINVFIRGIGQPDALQTFDPGVGVYVDDVYYSRINGALFSLFDVQQVEVLRGPQGTLYGKNSTGGAIKVITRQPEQIPEGAAEITMGNYGRLEGRMYATGPFSDTVAASIAAVRINTDGYVKDPVTGHHYNDDGTTAVRGKLAITPSESFSANIALDYTHQNNDLTLGRQEAPLIATDLVLGPVLLGLPPAGKYDFHGETSFGPGKGQKLTNKGISAHLDWNLSNTWLLKSISAYRKLETHSYIDIDASAFQLGDVLVALDQHQVSQELQLQYDNGDNVQGIFGLYYLREKVPSHQEAYADDFIRFAGAPVDFLRTIDDDLRTTSTAAFASGNWKFAPTWALSAGVRFTRESKDYSRSTTTFWGAPLEALDATFAFDADHDWTAWTPSISLQKELSDHSMIYVSANRGFKSGGFNGRANSPDEVSAYDPEYVNTYELGLKSTSADGRLLGNVTLFHSDYKDFQARVSEVQNPEDPIPTFAFPVLNAAKLKIDGIEFEGAALIGQSTRLSGQLGYLHARYDRFDDPRVAVDPNLADLHDHVPFSPKFTGRIALEHGITLGGGSVVTLGGDVSYRDKNWLSVDNRAVLSQDAYTLVGLYGMYESSDGHWQARAGVRNLTDKTYKTDAQEFSSVGNIQTSYYGMPRNYYVALRYNF